MNPIIFRDLTEKDKEIYEHYYRKSETELTDLTFTCRMAWNNIFNNQIAIYEDCCVLLSDGGIFTKPHILMPMGDLDGPRLDRILQAVAPIFSEHNWELKIMCIDEKKLPILSELSQFSGNPYNNEDVSDYVYDAESLRTLAGNQLHKKRNHVNKFLRLYPDYEYSSLTCADRDDCLELVKKWCESRSIPFDDPHKSDYMMIHKLFDLCGQADIRGGLIRINGTVCAFSLGSYGNSQCAYIHFEKADPAFDGSYTAINQFVLQNEFPEAIFVNREEDLGIPGLRRAKQSYFPIRLLKKYKIKLKSVS